MRKAAGPKDPTLQVLKEMAGHVEELVSATQDLAEKVENLESNNIADAVSCVEGELEATRMEVGGAINRQNLLQIKLHNQKARAYNATLETDPANKAIDLIMDDDGDVPTTAKVTLSDILHYNEARLNWYLGFYGLDDLRARPGYSEFQVKRNTLLAHFGIIGW